MIYKNRPRPEYFHLYTDRSTKLIRFPDHVTRMVDLNAFEWAILSWMIDGEGLDLSTDILPAVWACASCFPDPENYVSFSLSGTLDEYLYTRVQERGPETVDFVIRRFAA